MRVQKRRGIKCNEMKILWRDYLTNEEREERFVITKSQVPASSRGKQ